MTKEMIVQQAANVQGKMKAMNGIIYAVLASGHKISLSPPLLPHCHHCPCICAYSLGLDFDIVMKSTNAVFSEY